MSGDLFLRDEGGRMKDESDDGRQIDSAALIPLSSF
jgi:hypothetical protein